MALELSAVMTDASWRTAYMAVAKFDSDLASMAWYDSGFLRQYVIAKRLLKLIRPHDLDRFIDGFEILRTRKDYSLQRMGPVFDTATFDSILDVVSAMPDGLLERHEAQRFGRDVVHNLPYFTELQAGLVGVVSDMAGEDVVPSYNFLSLYSTMGVCNPHMDEPMAKWTLDICLSQNVEWPIYFSRVVDWPETPPQPGWTHDQLKSDPGLEFKSETLLPNKAILFAGSSQWHYRNAIASRKSAFCNLLFFHYYPKGAERLVYPELWSEHFDIPELAIISLYISQTYKCSFRRSYD